MPAQIPVSVGQSDGGATPRTCTTPSSIIQRSLSCGEGETLAFPQVGNDAANTAKPPSTLISPSTSERTTATVAQLDGTSYDCVEGRASPYKQPNVIYNHQGNVPPADPAAVKNKELDREAQLLLELKASEILRDEPNSDIESSPEIEQLLHGPIILQSGTRAQSPEERTEQLHREQIKYLKSVRELETKLRKARHNLDIAMKKRSERQNRAYWQENIYQDQGRIESLHSTKADMTPQSRTTLTLRKEDFLDLVDLYFYSHQSKFLSESPDSSPTPMQLDDYNFCLSEDFSPPTNSRPALVRDEQRAPGPPLGNVAAEINPGKFREIKAFQCFVDLLIDDYSSLSALFRAYRELPQPGVSHLPSGVIRLFLQRMSTPWKKSKKAMLRYLSLVDDMQRACLPITAWEWSSAIYLAGQSFNNVSNNDVTAAFRMWHKMENEAGVAARDVTFNILFDIAVKAEKFVLAEEILKEMHDRGFRLNRLGRVSLIYYYGKRRDGDGVRKAYRDFVDAGEIVDTLVLNCVMASLVTAQEPTAAEQIYERMKSIQERFQRGVNTDGEEALYIKYPPPGPESFGAEVASNALGRVLLRASRLKTTLSDHHAELQNTMPLTPNAVTYRTLMTHHARTSGNIDRLTVLLDDMTQAFGIPVTPLTFQLLFMGFAMHGGSRASEEKWTSQRLHITWTACLVCMKANTTKKTGSVGTAEDLALPSVEEAQDLAVQDDERATAETARRRRPPKPTAWDTFIKQFTSPAPEPRPFNLYPTSPDASETLTTDEPESDQEYHLPNIGLTPKTSLEEEMSGVEAIQPSKNLAKWIIRAFTRCTADRKVVEDVWYQISRVWRPTDPEDKTIAVRELCRGLRYCDIHGKRR